MPEPPNLFEPHMPEVDVPPDLQGVFTKARIEIASGDERRIGIVTPGRMVMLQPAPPPGSIPKEFVAQVSQLLPSAKPLNITFVGHTQLEALMQDKAKCIPQLGQLLGFAYLGHNVIVFEGHSSAFEYAVRDCDVLMIDSGMLAFLQPDWLDVALRAARPGAKMIVQDRKTGRLQPVIKSKNAQGWRYGEPDGEASYANCLLTMLAKAHSPVPVRIASGSPLPSLAQFAGDPAQREWIAELPFRYDALNVDRVIAILHRVVNWSSPENGESKGVLKAQVATGAGQRQAVSFDLTLGQDIAGKRRLEIAKSA
ncbi:MAG TPA: hypothetical protein VK687_07505 [Bryobacteraceae bacterium]|nr:hypothetical protein [Bryobacteraceae bacterium]